jgi:hypothetical protein
MTGTAAEMIQRADRILVATGEPWGVYHSAPLRKHYGPPVHQIVPTDAVDGESLTLADVIAGAGDILLISGSGPWPAQVALALTGTKTFAVRLAYLGANPNPDTPTVDRFWASTPNHAEELANEFMTVAEMVEVTPYPWEPERLVYDPAPLSVLLITSVSEADRTGGSATEANRILNAAGKVLAEQFDVIVALHPRENPAHWAGFTLAKNGTMPAASTAAVVVAVAGTVIEPVHQLGAPIVMIPAPGVPEHIFELGVVANTESAVVEAVRAQLTSSEQ